MMNSLLTLLLCFVVFLKPSYGGVLEVTETAFTETPDDFVKTHGLEEDEEMLNKIQSISEDISDGFETSNVAIDGMKTAIHENREILSDMKEMLLTIMHKQVYLEVCGKIGPSPLCSEHGTCKVQGEDQYTCQCDHGWRGEKCEARDYCADAPCENGGECINNGNAYKCICEYGYFASRCQLYGRCTRYLKGELSEDSFPDLVNWTEHVKCDEYGDFKNVQTKGQEVACVYLNGTIVDFPRFDKSLLLNTSFDCRCAVDLSGLGEARVCNPNGSYPSRTCVRGRCYCANENGNVTWKTSVKEEEADSLKCLDF